MFWYRKYFFIASLLRRNHFIGKSLCIRIKNFRIQWFTLAAIIFGASCKERYEPNIRPEQTNYLVVEGFINAQGSTNITLSRTAQLKDSAAIQPEQGAAITIMGEDNSTFGLFENTTGHYQSNSVTLNKNQKYRLLIKTTGGKEYLSDYLSVKQTPPIDSVSWRNESNGVNIYVNSHNEQNNSHYYKWTYEETWQIRSQWAVLFGYVNGNVSARDQNEINKMYHCWHSENSSSIVLGSTAGLSDNIISMIPIVNIPDYDEQLRIRYSILVRQVALDQQAYDFYRIMKRNTETAGSVFAPLPTNLSTNIHCVSNPAEKVIGYMSVSTEESKRIFISNAEVPGWNYQSGCGNVYVENDPSKGDPSELSSFANNGLIPYGTKTSGLVIEGYYASTESCMDCRTRGSNVKPDFW